MSPQECVAPTIQRLPVARSGFEKLFEFCLIL
jgi:hypothetical protein